MSGTPETRSSLLARVRNPRDSEAWEEFLSIYEPLIYRVARRKGLQDADAREVTQDVLVTLADVIPSWKPTSGRGSLRRWLFQVARNQSINLLKAKSRQACGTGDSKVRYVLENHSQPDDAQLFIEEYRRQLFRHASVKIRNEFSNKTWLAFLRTSIDGHSVSEVAQGLDMSIGAVYTARSRVLARLKKVVEELDQQDALDEQMREEI